MNYMIVIRTSMTSLGFLENVVLRIFFFLTWQLLHSRAKQLIIVCSTLNTWWHSAETDTIIAAPINLLIALLLYSRLAPCLR